MSRAVLGIDTSGTWCSVALLRADAVHARRADVGNAHAEHLLTLVDDVLVEADVALADCDAIAFGAGPGSFTGLRVACAVAQGLAFGAGLPVAAIGTLEALAHSLGADERAPPGTVLVAQDARMGEIYWALFERVDRRLVVRAGPGLSAPGSLRERLREIDVAVPLDIGCGNAWAIHGETLDGLVRQVVARVAADAVDVAALGMRAVIEGRLIAAADAAPIYVRNDVARTTAERAALARGEVVA
jgi:tRNA threonylcarbamoyladenosine biosynthesis protein TsaB